MPTVSVTNLSTISSDWEPTTCAGYPNAKSKMTAITSTISYSYFFPYEPVQIEYSNLGNEYVQIERPGNHPLLAYKAPKLTQVSFSFLAIDRSNIYDLAGEASIEKDLEFLAKFASLEAPIRFSGKTFLSSLKRQFGDVTSTPRAWRVTEFSMNVRRKTSDGDASQAECSITLIEDRNPNVTVVPLPKIVYPVIPPTKTKKPSKKPPTQPPAGGDAGGWGGT